MILCSIEIGFVAINCCSFMSQRSSSQQLAGLTSFLCRVYSGRGKLEKSWHVKLKGENQNCLSQNNPLFAFAVSAFV